jgi:molybdopterin synthase catalytic subunit
MGTVLLFIEFSRAPIAAPQVHLPSREIGAAVEFFGIVREAEGDRMLAGLWYEAYETMARRKLAGHIEALAERCPCAAVHFIHRLGWVPVGEASLFIRILSAHRREALAMMGELIDRLKQDVPIWKCVDPPSTPAN